MIRCFDFDRRRDYRYYLRFLVQSETMVVGRSRDISRRGLYFTTNIEYAQGTVVSDLCVSTNHLNLKLYGEVLRFEVLNEKAGLFGVAVRASKIIMQRKYRDAVVREIRVMV